MVRALRFTLAALLICWGAIYALPIHNITVDQGEEGKIVLDDCTLNEHILTVSNVDISFTDNFLVAIGVDDDDTVQLKEMDRWMTSTVRESIRVLGEFRAHTVVCASVHDFKGTTYAAWVRDFDTTMAGAVHWDVERKVAYCIVNDFGRNTISPVFAKGFIATAAFGYARLNVQPLAPVLVNAIVQHLTGFFSVNQEAFRRDLRARQFLASPALATVEGTLSDGIKHVQVLAAQVAIGELLAASPNALAILMGEYCEQGWGYKRCLQRLDQLAYAAGVMQWSQSFGCFRSPQAGLWGYQECGPQGFMGKNFHVVARDELGNIPTVAMEVIDVCQTKRESVPANTIYSIPFSTLHKTCSSADWFLLRAVINGKRHGVDYIFDQ